MTLTMFSPKVAPLAGWVERFEASLQSIDSLQMGFGEAVVPHTFEYEGLLASAIVNMDEPVAACSWPQGTKMQ